MSITVKDAKNYFGVYLNNATNTPNTVTKQNPPVQVSQIPNDVTLETLIALTTYKPQVFQGTTLQKYGQNTQIIQSAITNRLITNNNLVVDNLGSFVPSNFSGNAIQRRKNGVVLPLGARGFLLRGINPETQRALKLLEDARRLIRARNDINRALQKVENQINRYTAIFNALVNLPGAIASAAITKLIDILTKLQTTYDALKRAAELVASALRTIRDKWRAWKARRKQAKEAEKKAEDIQEKLTKAPERPRIVLFPKFPKRPRLNWSKADFYQKYRKALENLKNKDGEFYKQAYAIAQQNAGFEIIDPTGKPKINPFTGQIERDRFGRIIKIRPDAIQRGLTNARNKLREVRARIETAQTIRTAAVNQARQQVIDNIRKTAAVVEEGRKQAVKEYQNAIERRNQIGARKRYLAASEQLRTDISIDLNFKNIFGDKPTGEVSSDGKRVYKDESSTRQQGSVTVFDENYGKKYVLISVTERVQTARNNIDAAVLGTAQKITNVVNSATNVANIVGGTLYNVQTSISALSGSLNDKQVAADLTAGIIQSAQQTTQYTSIINNIATQQVQSQEQAEQNARKQAEIAQQQQLQVAYSASVAGGYSGSLSSFDATIPQAALYIPILYRVVSNGVRFRQEPGNSGKIIKQLTINDALNLITTLASGTSTGRTSQFVSKDNLLWGNFKLISTGETGWIAINLITPRIPLTGTP